MPAFSKKRPARPIEIPAASWRMRRHAWTCTHRYKDIVFSIRAFWRCQFEERREIVLCIAHAPFKFGCLLECEFFTGPHPKVANLWHDGRFPNNGSGFTNSRNNFHASHPFQHTESMRESVV